MQKAHNFFIVCYLNSGMPFVCSDGFHGEATVWYWFPTYVPHPQRSSLPRVCIGNDRVIHRLWADDIRCLCCIAGLHANRLVSPFGECMRSCSIFHPSDMIMFEPNAQPLSSSSLAKIGQACRPLFKKMGFWDSIKELGRAYEYVMGLLIFVPIVVLSWFPFVSEFQTRLLFNQAFSRGLQISMILAGKTDSGVNMPQLTSGK